MSLSKLTIPTIAVAPAEVLTVIELPPQLTNDEKTTLMAGLISTMSHPFADQRSCVEWVYNLLVFGVPEIDAYAPSWQTITANRVQPTRAELLTWVGAAEPGTEKENPSLPALPGPVRPQAFGVTDRRGYYLALSSLLYAVGKQASESARASAMDNRPDALIRRFDLSEENQALLPGKDAGPSREALEQVYNSFANYTEVRTTVIVPFLSLRKNGLHLPIHLEIMMTNFNLLRGAGMTHVEAVIKLVRMHPWVLGVPELEPYFYQFADELSKWKQLPLEVREYHRLLVPQAEYMFLSSDYRPVVAVAGSFIEEVEKTFANYVYNRATYQDLIDKVKARAPGYTATGQLSRLASLLDVKEEPMPPLPSRPLKEDPPTV